MSAAPVPCRRCGAPIVFRATPNGRLQPVDPATGAVHFATCPNRPPAKTAHLRDDVCLRCGSLNTERRPGTPQHYAGLTCREPGCGGFRWLPRPRPSPPTAPGADPLREGGGISSAAPSGPGSAVASLTGAAAVPGRDPA